MANTVVRGTQSWFPTSTMQIAPAIKPVPFTSSSWSFHHKDTQTNSSCGSFLRPSLCCISTPENGGCETWGSIQKLTGRLTDGQILAPDWFPLVSVFATLQLELPSWLHIILPPLPQITSHHHLPTSLSSLGLFLSLWSPLNQGWKQQSNWGQSGLSESYQSSGNSFRIHRSPSGGLSHRLLQSAFHCGYWLSRQRQACSQTEWPTASGFYGK